MEQILDLFGQPIVEGRGKRGRPKHEPSVESRNKISMLLAFGWTDERIANAIGVSKPTLYKYYFNEMKRRLLARDMMDAHRLEKLWQLAMEGNVAAHKEFGRLLEKNDAIVAERDFRGQDDDDEDAVPKAGKLGKKEVAALAAAAVERGDDDWGSDLAFRGRRLDS